MPRAADADVRRFRRYAGSYRLRCRKCNREHDGIKKIPDDWTDIERRQSLLASLSVYEPDEPNIPANYSASEWETHTGLCPTCSPKKRKLRKR